MANDQERNPGSEQSDISKSQSQQQPQGQSGEQRETGEKSGQFETAQEGRQEFGQDQGGSPDEGTQGDTLTQQRTDVEGESRPRPESGEAESGFVGSQGQQDSSSELVDEEDDQRRSDGE